MTGMTLKSLHAYLRLIENASEMKRRMPTSYTPKTLKEGLYELGKFASLDTAVFKNPQNIAAAIGAQRFVMIRGEPSVTDRVAHVFDSSKLLLTVIIEHTHFENATLGQFAPASGAAHPPPAAKPATKPGWTQPKIELPAARPQSNPDQETALDNLKPLLAGNAALSFRLFRAIFEQMFGFVSPAIIQQGTVSMVNELIGRREHSRPFFSTALFILGAEVDRDNLGQFMMEQGLFGLHIFEHLLQNRDYCDAYYAFRRLERAFTGPPAEEETKLRNRTDKFSAQFAGKPCEGIIFEADEQDKARVDAYFAAADLLEAMTLTPWCFSLNNAIAIASTNYIRSLKTIAGHFERFAGGVETKDRANKEIADHLLAFAGQFSADSKPV